MQNTSEETSHPKPLLEVKNLKKYFPVKDGVFGQTKSHVKAVDDVSFTIYEGETLSIVGESGCGKSTTGRAILRLDEPTDGEILYNGQNLIKLGKKEMRKKRKDIQVVFQDPFGSLNPRQTIGQILTEALAIQKIVPKEKRRERAIELLQYVGLRPEQIDRFPHEFSGGQRQRIGIARAIAIEPRLIICDEAVSALDVSVKAQVLNLLKSLQSKFKLTYLFISHDLSVVHHLSDRVIVMYLGKIVEIADKHSLFDRPQHPYTQALLSAIPDINNKNRRERILLQGDVPSPLNPPHGCRFHTRCPMAVEQCKRKEPELRSIHESHYVACHLVK